MPATSPEAIARKYQRRKERKATDPDYRRACNARREAGRNQVYKDRRLAKAQAKTQAIRRARPFVGCDGEGAKEHDPTKTGVNALSSGRSSYVLFRMGDRELHRGGDRLTTPELLQFIVDYPDPAAILVGFFFEYDISNILRDVPATRDPDKPAIPSRLERILQVDLKAAAGAANPYQFGGWTCLRFEGYPDFGVQYIPRNFIKVCRLHRYYDRAKKRSAHRAAKGSTRTIFDTQGFFQCSFVKALELWRIGLDHLPTIAAMKADRATFAGLTDQVRRYCAIECELLAQMMDAFRDQCIATDMEPRTWNGAGKIATALLKRHNAITRARLHEITPAPVLDLAHAAYYGGRFETTWAGRLPATWEHDIGSAYPAAMLELPCLEHGRWIKQTRRQLDQLSACSLDPAKTGVNALSPLFVARLRFEHPPNQFLCGLPFRSKAGRLSWPRNGNGVYWSPEIRSAQRLGADITFKDGYRFEPGECDCKGYGFVRDLYELRRQIGKSVRGIPIKLGLNSIYGKTAQRIGKPAYANPIAAGLITALTRAKINDAIIAAGDPRRVVMIATDGVYSVGGPIEGLDQGDGLGQWEVKQFPSLFIVRPGLYWPITAQGSTVGASKLKTRGLSPKFFAPLVPIFEAAWDQWLATPSLLPGLPDPATVPIVPVPIETFVGVRLAMRLGDPTQSCQWIKRNVDCKFSWIDKRAGVQRLGGALVLGALPGDPDAHSHHYDASQIMQSSVTFELDRMIFEAHPDYLDIGPPLPDEGG
jgi:hypothetical protein